MPHDERWRPLFRVYVGNLPRTVTPESLRTMLARVHADRGHEPARGRALKRASPLCVLQRCERGRA